jgi:hypothetical protein
MAEARPPVPARGLGGFGAEGAPAASKCRLPGRWDDALEARLRKEWDETNEPSTWEKVKRAVRHGFEATLRNHPKEVSPRLTVRHGVSHDNSA